MGRRRQLYLLITIATVFSAAIWSLPVKAAPLLSAADYLNRQQADVTSGISHHLFFTPATNMLGGGNIIRIVFPTSPINTWCRVSGAGLGVVGINDPPGVTEGATPLPGALTASCTGGDGITTFDTITISNIDPFMAGTKYGVAITDPATAKLGTPPAASNIKIQLTTNNGSADIDTLPFYTTIMSSDRVVISAVVLEQNPILPDPVVRFSGLAGSAADLTITRNSTVVHSSTLGQSGQFDVTLSNQPVGEQTYVVSAKDDQGNSFSSLTFVLNLQLNTNTDLSNIFLGPSISVNAMTFVLGEQITFSGTTVPLSAVTLDLSSDPLSSYATPADTTGRWQIAVNSSDLGLGTFTAHARSVFNSNTSAFSPQVSVTINAAGSPNTNTTPPSNANSNVSPGNTNTTPSINTNTDPGSANSNVTSPGNTNTSPSINTNRQPNTNTPVVGPPEKIALTDFNADKKVNLIDFSIMMFYWHQSNPANPAVDVNHDGTVDIIDISIMLFQWTSIV